MDSEREIATSKVRSLNEVIFIQQRYSQKMLYKPHLFSEYRGCASLGEGSSIRHVIRDAAFFDQSFAPPRLSFHPFTTFHLFRIQPRRVFEPRVTLHFALSWTAPRSEFSRLRVTQ